MKPMKQRSGYAMIACLLLFALIVPVLGGCDRLFTFGVKTEQEQGQIEEDLVHPTFLHYARLYDVKARYDKHNVRVTLAFGFYGLTGPYAFKADVQHIEVGVYSDEDNLRVLREENGDIDLSEYEVRNRLISAREGTGEIEISHSETVTIPAEYFRQEKGDIVYLFSWADCGEHGGVYNQIAIPYEMEGDNVIILTEYINLPPESQRPNSAYSKEYLPSISGENYPDRKRYWHEIDYARLIAPREFSYYDG